MTTCPLCKSPGEELFTGYACSGRDCENYDEKTQPRIPILPQQVSLEDLEAWITASSWILP